MVGLVLAGNGLAPAAPAPPTLDALLDQLGDYLRAYEDDLGAVVATESYVQTHTYPGRADQPYVVSRRIESEVAFLRLPGALEWFGLRETRTVNGRAVPAVGPRLRELLDGAARPLDQARAMMAASAAHNLGEPRTINMPTVPLEILHPRNRDRLQFREAGTETVRRTSTVRLAFLEVGRPTIIGTPRGSDVMTEGTAWVEPGTGRVLSAEVFFRGPGANRAVHRRPDDSNLWVEFAVDRRLALLVPVEMRERFQARGRGEGRATYRDFRRFGTSARLIGR
jgi:hypothetical protein